MTTSARLHALDNLRALMMWLGIVLHVLVQHMAGPTLLPWRDPQTTPVADVLLAFIHAFRMPTFFILAGFFMALLVERRGPAETLRHRMKRFALPFAIFWPPVFLAMGALSMAFMYRVAHGRWGIDISLMPQHPNTPPINTAHLWFLYLLIWFSLMTYVVCRWAHRVPAGVRRALSAGVATLGRRAWGIPLLTLPLVLAGLPYVNGLLTPSGSFMPPWPEWLHNGAFFLFGWYLHQHQSELFQHYMNRWAAYAWGGFAAFMASGALLGPPESQALRPPALIAFVYGMSSWAWSFAFIGLFLKHMPRRNRVLGYLSDSSYWVYIVHMIGTIGIGALLVTAPLPALAKVTINITATSALALLSYQLFVRHTWVGRLLNGPSARPSTPPAPGELADRQPAV